MRNSLVILLVLAAVVRPAAAQDAVMPGELVTERPTVRSLGFRWYVDGDADRDASVRVTYRRSGTSEWHEALPLLRIGGEEAGQPEIGYVTPHLFAGSVMDLDPGTAYECRFEMHDPDGVSGASSTTVVVETRPVPSAADATGEVRHVYPEHYEGDRMEPSYDGLLHAYYGYPRFADWNLTIDPVEPGDEIVLHAGEYEANPRDYRDYEGVTFHGTYELTQKGTAAAPIVIRAAGDGDVVFDGAGAYNLFNVLGADYHHFEGFTVRNTAVAFLAGFKDVTGSDGLVVRDMRIEDVGIGIMAEYAGSEDFYIADNYFVGREDSTHLKEVSLVDGRRVQTVDGYYAVKVCGRGHAIEHNYAAYFFDGIDVSTGCASDDPPTTSSIDILNNDVVSMSDNCIEADGAAHNVRILRNRCVNTAQQVLSNQPVMGGPVYWIRNIVYHAPDASAMKTWHTRAAGVLIYHNTFLSFFAAPTRGTYSNIHLRNNLFVPPDEDKYPPLALTTYTSYSTADYNAYHVPAGQDVAFYWHAPAEGRMRDYELAHDPLEFATLADFQAATGQERHGMLVDYDIFRDLEPAVARRIGGPDLIAFQNYDPDALDFRLREGAPVVDAGARLPNVNDDFVAAAPDLGALELGQPVPHYGPREDD